MLEKSCSAMIKMLEKSCNMKLNRKIIRRLEEWKENVPNKALLIKGARQVGKTTIV